MNLKPLISCKYINTYFNDNIQQIFIKLDSGDNILFKSIQTRIEQALPTDKIEWKRSYGRGTAKNIKLEANFKTFESCKAQIESYNSQNFDILKDPSLHLYISECNVRGNIIKYSITYF